MITYKEFSTLGSELTAALMRHSVSNIQCHFPMTAVPAEQGVPRGRQRDAQNRTGLTAFAPVFAATNPEHPPSKGEREVQNNHPLSPPPSDLLSDVITGGGDDVCAVCLLLGNFVTIPL